jgi:FtsH-binding integral membrane protein
VDAAVLRKVRLWGYLSVAGTMVFGIIFALILVVPNGLATGDIEAILTKRQREILFLVMFGVSSLGGGAWLGRAMIHHPETKCCGWLTLLTGVGFCLLSVYLLLGQTMRVGSD